jgi:hypothetical protein
LDQDFGHPEPKVGSVLAFGREKSFKDPLPVLWSNTWPVISNQNAYP